jgi:ParB family chromosome partitioning protein
MTTTICIQNSPTPFSSHACPLAPTSSRSSELWTPPFYADKVRAVLGEVDLDPFSCAGANLTVQAKRYFVKGDAPFKQDWRAKTIFIHPPSSRTFLNKIPKKFLKEWRRRRIEQAIILLDTPPTGFCYAVLAQRADAVCLTYLPIPFLTPNGETQRSGAGQALLYFGHDPARFRQVFASVGAVSMAKKAPPRTTTPAKKVRRRRRS